MLKQVLEDVALVVIDLLKTVRYANDDILGLTEFSALLWDLLVDVVIDALAFALSFAHEVEQGTLVVDCVRGGLSTYDWVLVLDQGALRAAGRVL